MATLNDRYQDILIRHAIEVERFKSGAARRAITILNQAEADLERLLRNRFPGARTPAGRRRLEKLLQQLRDQRAAVWLRFRAETRADVLGLASMEVDFTRGAFVQAAQLEDVALAVPLAQQVRTAALSTPFQGQPLRKWFGGLQRADQTALDSALRLGFVEGESVDQVVRRVRGTRANRFKDGILQTNRNKAEAVVRTALNHASNQARLAVFEENSSVIRAYVWSSVLDGRTTPICRARDRRGTPTPGNTLPEGIRPLQPPNAMPPAHVNCRSAVVAVVSPSGLVGNRPFVRDVSTRRVREIRFRRRAREAAGDRWRGMTERQRRRAVKNERERWADENVGQVPARTSYQEWLGRQSAQFQDEVLGKTRGALFRRGDLSLDKFVDRSGRQYNLRELRRREAGAFAAANLD